MKLKTSELTETALAYCVMRAAGVELKDAFRRARRGWFAPQNDWSQGGFIIEREEIEIHKRYSTWYACINYDDGRLLTMNGPTPLVAAMRCYVASRLGEEVDVPETLK